MHNTFIGTDIIQTSRLNSWAMFSHKKLTRVFSTHELTDCSGPNGLIPEKLAVRFAAKEAFYKALSALLVSVGKTEQRFGFLVTCPYVCVVKAAWDVPQLEIDWPFFEDLVGCSLPEINAQISLSHEREYAVAFVMLSIDASLTIR